MFEVGDVVYDKDRPELLGVVTAARERGLDVCWEDGSRSGGPGLLHVLRHRHINVVVPVGALLRDPDVREAAIAGTLVAAGLR